jgi:hypothetical protein
MKNILFAIALSLLVNPIATRADAYGSGWYGEIQAVVMHEDNVSRSFKDEDQVSDQVTSLSFGGGYSTKLGRKSQLILKGYTTYNAHAEFDDLDHLAISLGFDIAYQPAAGYGATWISLAANGTWLEYRNNDAREGAFFDLDLGVNRRLSTRMIGHLGYRYLDHVFVNKSEQQEIDAAAFDVASHEAYVSVDIELRRSVFVYGEYAFRHGGLTSSVSGLVPLGVNYVAESLDSTYNRCNPDLPDCDHRYAYRVVSDMHRISLGVAFPLGTTSMDLNASYLEAQGEDGGPKYEDWTVRLGAVWEF